MKTNKFLIGLSLMAAGLTGFSSCSSDKLGDADDIINPDSPDAGVYMAVTIEMPKANGSRSNTTTGGQSNSGVEEGSNDENTVNSAYIVLATKDDNQFITYGEVLSGKLTPSVNNTYKSVAKIDKTRLNSFYNDFPGQTEVNVFVFCNPSTQMIAEITGAAYKSTAWINSKQTVGHDADELTGNKKAFVMTNASLATRKIPANLRAWDSYKSEATAFDFSGWNNQGTANEVDNSVGAISVQRNAARFDFKDGSPATTEANTYDVVKDKDNKTLIQIVLGKMMMLNHAKQMYNIKRVSATGLDAGATILGNEYGDVYNTDRTEVTTPANYVVGPYASAFQNFNLLQPPYNPNAANAIKFSDYFYCPYFNDNGVMDYSVWDKYALLSDVLKSDKPSDNYGAKEYKVWLYTSENVIPATNSNQQYGISTGVVFKGKMKATTDMLNSTNADTKAAAESINNVGGSKLTGDPAKDPILYLFNGTLYMTWNQVQKAAILASVTMENNVPKLVDGKLQVNRANSLYIAVYGKGGMGNFTWGTTKYTDELAEDNKSANYAWTAWDKEGRPNSGATLTAMRAAVTGANFTIYQSSKDDQLGGAGYYCYYFYMNRHNDNGQAGVRGTMEFAVVRNNVYKLAVTGIHQLGHPRIPENDPDKPDPNTPDEKDDVYMTVTFSVLPWVVRVNNIEF